MKDPRVAVITRTQNRPVFLTRALSSVRNQTFRNLIHVVYNDAGDAEKVNDIIAKSSKSNIKVIHNEQSKGMEAASNQAIRAIDSEYIAIHDDDDTWHPEMLQRAIGHLNETGAMGVVVRTNKVVEEIQVGGMISTKKTTAWMPDMKAVNLYRQCIDNQMTPITFVYRRVAFDELNGYDESLPVCGDWDFGIRFLQKWDVEYLDPGFALANYHHRVFKRGAEGNTSYAGNDKAAYYTNQLMNKYLRQELAEGRLGVGYIMSQLRFNESRLAQYVKKIMPSPLFRKIKKTVQG